MLSPIDFFRGSIAENKNRKVANYGKRIVRKIQEMFSMIHLRDSMTEMKWKRRMNIQKKKLLKSLQWGVPDDKDASNLVKRLQKYEEEYFRFIHHPIPPTNNPAEQTIRKVVLDRKVTRERGATGAIVGWNDSGVSKRPANSRAGICLIT